MFRLLVAGYVVACIASQSACAQVHAPAGHLPPNSAFVVDGNGTSVQLPQFNFFTISTSVMVPDRGSAVLGGVGRASSASGQSGLPLLPQRAIGGTHTAGGISVSVQVHDLKAMDRELLADAAAARRTDDPARAWYDRVAQAKQSSAGRPTISVAEARRLRDAQSPVR